MPLTTTRVSLRAPISATSRSVCFRDNLLEASMASFSPGKEPAAALMPSYCL